MEKIGNFLKILTIFTLFFISTVYADVKVRSFSDRRELGMGDTIDIIVQVASSESVDATEPNLPDLNDFTVLNTWTSNSTSSKLMQGPNGMEFQTLRQIEYHYTVTPKRAGKLQVPAFQVSVDGKNYNTEPFILNVSKQGSGAAQLPNQNFDDELDEAEKMFNQLLQRQVRPEPAGPQVVPKNPNEAFFVYADIDKKEVYEGEQITANWYLYSRGNILSLDRLKFPDLKGFWKEIVEEVPALTFTQEVLNGVAYRRALLASHALFPIKPGIAVIDEYKIKASVQLPTSQFGVFGFGKPYNYTRSSERIQIKVKPLPTEGRPQDFSGAVGDFEVSAQVEHQELPQNQPFSLKLRFEGQGNAKLIELPPLALPKGIESYDVKSDAKFFKNGRSYKEFDITLIPREPGELKIPEISVSLFNPQTGRYYTKKTGEILLKITGAAAAINSGNSATTIGGVNNPTDKGETSAKAATKLPDLTLPSLNTEFQSNSSILNASSSIKYWILLGAILASSLFLYLKARREILPQKKRSSLQNHFQKRMRNVWKVFKNNNWRETATTMSNTLNSILGQMSGELSSSTDIRNLLEKLPPSIRRDYGVKLQEAVDLFQLISFAPESAVEIYKNRDELKKKISETESLIKKCLSSIQEKDLIEKDPKGELAKA